MNNILPHKSFVELSNKVNILVNKQTWTQLHGFEILMFILRLVLCQSS